METYSDLIQEFPHEIQFSMTKLIGRLREEVINTVTKADFKRLESVVSALGDKTLELAEAQNRTEKRVEELAEAQNRTEKRVEELAEAQNRTEKRVEELAIAQNNLAEAQKKTEKTLQGVIKKQDNMARELGGLANSFGYYLENEAINKLPGYLKRTRNIAIDIMDRRFMVYPDGKDDEINIYGEGVQNGNTVYIIGESKSQLGKKDIDRFKKLLERVTGHLGASIIPIMLTHSVHPSVEAYAQTILPELFVIKSYELK